MKIYSKYLLSLLYLINNRILQSKADVVIDDEVLNNYTYGAREFKMAIIGDSGSEKEAKKVMQLTNFDILLHLGDYEYKCNVDKYFDEILDSDRKYQFLGVLGNHEGASECNSDKHERFTSRVYHQMDDSTKNSKVSCYFSDSRKMWSCKYRNMRIIGLSAGISGADDTKRQLSFLKEQLSKSTEDWKICAWHFYDKYYHTGKYPDDGNLISKDGESFYDYCREHGAIIFSAHDHVYARTKVMSKFSSPHIDEYDDSHDKEHKQIRKGATINILNGAGGYEMYIEQGKQKSYSHWQLTYARGDHGENADRYGGLFCNFNVDGNNKKAYCEFLLINSSNRKYDEFFIYQNENPGNVTYQDIENNFKEEKIQDYKRTHNIVDPIIDQTTNTTAKPEDSVGGGGVSDEGIMTDDDKKNNAFNVTILVIGSVCAAMVVVGFGLVTYRKKRHNIEDNDFPPKVNDDSFNFLGYLDSYRHMEDSKTSGKEKRSVKDHKIDLGSNESYKTLSEELGYIYQNPKITFDSETSSFNDAVPLVNNQSKKGEKNYSSRKMSDAPLPSRKTSDAPLPSRSPSKSSKSSYVQKSPSYKNNGHYRSNSNSANGHYRNNSNSASYAKTSKYNNKYY